MKKVIEMKPPKPMPRLASALPPAEEDLQSHVCVSVWIARERIGAALEELIRDSIAQWKRGIQPTSLPEAIQSAKSVVYLLRGARVMLDIVQQEDVRRSLKDLMVLGDKAISAASTCLAHIEQAGVENEQRHWTYASRSRDDAKNAIHVWLRAICEEFPEGLEQPENEG